MVLLRDSKNRAFYAVTTHKISAKGLVVLA
jgi:hypothetical protein